MLVPERVTALIALPIKPDWRISYGVILTEISSIASNEMGAPPAGRLPPIPKLLLKSAPSIVKLFWRKLPPPIDAPLDCGVASANSR